MSKRKIREETPSNIYILPIAFIITIVPLIVFMKVINLSEIEIKNWLGKSTYTDFFSYYKSQWLIVGSVMSLVFFLVYSLIKKFELKKSFLYIPTLTYAGFVIISTIASDYPKVAVSGFVARYEGMLVLLCYLAIFLITFNLVRAESQIKFILGAFLISSAIIGIIGTFQFLGKDLFRTEFGKLLILPSGFHHIADSVNFRFGDNFVYTTLNNPNYVGSYVALALPIAFVSMLYFKKPYFKISAAILVVLLLISLFGSRSRAGLLGLGVSFFIGVLIFRKTLFKKKILAFASITLVIIIFFSMNYILNGMLTKRIISEVKQLSSNEIQFFDLQDITIDGKTATIISSTSSLTIENRDSRIYFFDSEGTKLEYKMKVNDDSTVISFIDPKFKGYNITISGNVINIKQKGVEFKLRAAEETFQFIGLNGDETTDIQKPKSIGFVNKERLGTARGYIWSRTLPMLENSIIWGYGPDTFAIEFPQNDYIGKIRAYGTPQMIVDKPHNMYLQVAVNTGVLSLISVLVLWMFYMVQSAKLYIKNIDNSLLSLAGVGIFLSICGYLAAGFFNDSMVAVTPVFWVLLGLGFVCNVVRYNTKEIAKGVK